jgi:methionine-rich copper-binding protein CopC
MTRAAAVTLMLATMLSAGAGIAAAHAVLVATDPEKNAELSAGPDRVTATFNERLQDTFAAMTVVGPDRHLWHDGQAQTHGADVSVALRPLGPAGTYTVHYRVTSADGHPVSGSWPFRLTTPGTGQPGPPVSDSQSGSSDDSGGDVPTWPFVLGVIAAVGVGLWATHRKR